MKLNKDSIQFKIPFYLFIFVTVMLLFLWISEILLLDTIYRKTKTDTITEVGQYISENINHPEIEKNIEQIALRNDVCIAIFDHNGTPTFQMGCSQNEFTNTSRLFERMNDAYKNNGTFIEEVKKTVGLINNLISGTPIDEVSTKLEYEVKPIIGNYVKQHEQLYNAFYHVFNDFTNQEVNIVGRHKILEQPEFSSNIEKIKTVFNKLEDRETLRSIEEDGDNNIKVYIGNENNIDSDVTVIKTKFKSGDEEGTIAIIGPKRMEYDRVVGLLEYMKENIER